MLNNILIAVWNDAKEAAALYFKPVVFVYNKIKTIAKSIIARYK